MRTRTKVALAAITAGLALTLGSCACSSPADTVSSNLSKDADQFRILRRITFINGITDHALLVIEGYCSLGNFDKPREMSVTCKIGKDKYIKDFAGLSDNVTYTVEQLEPVASDPYHYKFFFRPETLIPNPEG